MVTMTAMTTIRISKKKKKKRHKEKWAPAHLCSLTSSPSPGAEWPTSFPRGRIESRGCLLACVDQEWEGFKTEACWLHGVQGGLFTFPFHVLEGFCYTDRCFGVVSGLLAVGCLYLSGNTRSYISLGLFQC